MSIIHDSFSQGSEAWLAARAGLPTVSEFDQLVTPKFEIRTGQMPQSYLARKLAEYWLGGPLLGFNGFTMEQGNILEEQAKPWYSLEYGVDIRNVGLVTTEDGRIGCSPDGLIGEDGGIEVKCPEAPQHVKYLLAGVVPDDYLAQVHGALYVTGRQWWDFVSYRRHFPALVVRTQRDEAIIQKLDEALQEFLERFEDRKLRLINLNVGPSRRRIEMLALRDGLKKEPVKFSWDEQEAGITP